MNVPVVPFTQKYCFDVLVVLPRLSYPILSSYIISASENTLVIWSAGHTHHWQTELYPAGIFFLITNLILWPALQSKHRQKQSQLVSVLPHMTSAEAVLWVSFDNNLWPGTLLKAEKPQLGVLTERAGSRPEKSKAQLTSSTAYETLFFWFTRLGQWVFVRRVHSYNPDILPSITSFCV